MPVVSVNGTSLAYEEHGPADGPCLVFGHSLFFTRAMFRHQVEHFSADHRVITYDHRGQGGSAPAPSETLDMDTLADDAAALIEALHAAPCHYVGNSMGGFIALRLAARRPDLLLSAVALGSSAEAEYRIEEFAPLVEHMRRSGARDLVTTLMYIMFGDTTLTDAAKKDLREEWYAYMEGLPASIGDAAHGVVYRTSVLEELSSAQVPILAIAGEEDHAYAPRLSENIARAAPHARYACVPAAGHSVSLERPDSVNALLAEHFATTR